MTNRSRRLDAGVEGGGRVDRPVPEHPPNDLVPARIRVQVDFGHGMPEQMRVHHQPRVSADGLANLKPESDALLRAAPPELTLLPM